MKPKNLSPKNILLCLAAVCIFGLLARWGSLGFPLPGSSVPSTAGKLVVTASVDGKSDVFLLEAKAGSPLVNLTNDEPDDGEPFFSTSGQTIAFTSNRYLTQFGSFATGDVRHLCVIDAAPRQKIIQLTRSAASSGTKERPMFHKSGNVYYLDGGRLISVNADGGDPKAVFPHAEMKRENRLIAEIFEYGGVNSFAINADETFALIVIKREHDQLSLMYDMSTETPFMVARGKVIIPMFLPDGRAALILNGGIPLPQAVPIGMDMLDKLPSVAAVAPSEEGVEEDNSRITLFSSALAVDNVVELPIQPENAEVTLDGLRLVFWSAATGGKGGMGSIPIAQDGAPFQLSNKPVTAATLSPDSKQCAFVTNGIVYVNKIDGSGIEIQVSPSTATVRGVHWSPAIK